MSQIRKQYAYDDFLIYLPRGDDESFSFVVSSRSALLDINGTLVSGTFTLTFRGEETGPIAYNATAATVQEALESLSTVRAGNIVCSGGPLSTTVAIDFANFLSDALPFELISDSGRLGGTNAEAEITAETTDISGYTEFWLTAKKRREDADTEAVFQLTYTGGDIAKTDAANGKATVTVVPGDWARLQDWKETTLWVDIQGKDASAKIHTLATGKFIVSPDTTRSTS